MIVEQQALWKRWRVTRRVCRGGFTLVELLVVITIIGILISQLLPAVQSAREAARRLQCSNNLKQLALASHNYAFAHETLPISMGWLGDRLSGKGWILSTLPFLEQQNLYDQFEPHFGGAMWSNSGILHPDCRDALKTPLAVLRCPSDGVSKLTDVSQFQTSPHEAALTSYKGVLGTDLNCRTTANCDGSYWMATFRGAVPIATFRDGMSNTITIGEDIAAQNAHSAAFYANGDYSTTQRPLNTFFEPAIPNNWPTVMTFRSYHPGGAFFATGDGGVHFISETIDFQLYQDLSTRRGGESASLR